MAESIRSSMRHLTQVLKECLENNGYVDIEGLGLFYRREDGQLFFTPQKAPRVFLAYVQEDLRHAQKLCHDLRRLGIDPWLDRERLVPGQNWPRAIEAAIEVADFFVPLFSRRSVVKRSQFQCELRYALDCATRQPLDQPFVMPVRLNECRVPATIAGTFQYKDLFPDWDAAVAELAAAITAASKPAG